MGSSAHACAHAQHDSRAIDKPNDAHVYVRVWVQGAGNKKGEKPGPTQHTIVDFCPTQDLFSGDSKGDCPCLRP